MLRKILEVLFSFDELRRGCAVGGRPKACNKQSADVSVPLDPKRLSAAKGELLLKGLLFLFIKKKSLQKRAYILRQVCAPKKGVECFKLFAVCILLCILVIDNLLKGYFGGMQCALTEKTKIYKPEILYLQKFFFSAQLTLFHVLNIIYINQIGFYPFLCSICPVLLSKEGSASTDRD